jgi:hypothetical protein
MPGQGLRILLEGSAQSFLRLPCAGHGGATAVHGRRSDVVRLRRAGGPRHRMSMHRQHADRSRALDHPAQAQSPGRLGGFDVLQLAGYVEDCCIFPHCLLSFELARLLFIPHESHLTTPVSTVRLQRGHGILSGLAQSIG